MLSELQCRKAKPGAKPYKHADGLGLSLLDNNGPLVPLLFCLPYNLPILLIE